MLLFFFFFFSLSKGSLGEVLSCLQLVLKKGTTAFYTSKDYFALNISTQRRVKHTQYHGIEKSSSIKSLFHNSWPCMMKRELITSHTISSTKSQHAGDISLRLWVNVAIHNTVWHRRTWKHFGGSPWNGLRGGTFWRLKTIGFGTFNRANLQHWMKDRYNGVYVHIILESNNQIHCDI